ncbi:MAG: hypothetical protein IBX40_06565 [Methanosarcinales archaeon]|nr:hypothetical protein [Methanosarcinales archaeon]
MEDKAINSAWFKKGATLSDKSAQKEFGLTQDEIIEGIEMKKIKKELAQTNKELKTLKTQVVSLEQRKAELLANLDNLENND